MSAVEYAADQDAAQLDAAQERKERMGEYVQKRADELYERRTASMSTVDFILALEIISTLPKEISRLHYLMQSEDSPLAIELRGMVKGAILTNCVELAVTEAMAMEEEPISRERH
jgi:hypothetical protein